MKKKKAKSPTQLSISLTQKCFLFLNQNWPGLRRRRPRPLQCGGTRDLTAMHGLPVQWKEETAGTHTWVMCMLPQTTQREWCWGGWPDLVSSHFIKILENEVISPHYFQGVSRSPTLQILRTYHQLLKPKRQVLKHVILHGPAVALTLIWEPLELPSQRTRRC